MAAAAAADGIADMSAAPHEPPPLDATFSGYNIAPGLLPTAYSSSSSSSDEEDLDEGAASLSAPQAVSDDAAQTPQHRAMDTDSDDADFAKLDRALRVRASRLSAAAASDNEEDADEQVEGDAAVVVAPAAAAAPSAAPAAGVPAAAASAAGDTAAAPVPASASPAPASAAPAPASAAPAAARRPIGLIHKEVGFRTIGSWQLISWRLRYCFTTSDALCYQHVHAGSAKRERRRGQPVRTAGRPKSIPFASIHRVGVQRDDQQVLVLQCTDRDYTFRFKTAPDCAEWAAALTQLARTAADEALRNEDQQDPSGARRQPAASPSPADVDDEDEPGLRGLRQRAAILRLS